MGAGAVRRLRFLADHPACIFCGGNSPSATIEHCPPRAMFQFRAWPEGFEFAACADCNHGTSDHDLFVSMLARLDPIEGRGDLDGRGRGIFAAVDKQYPGVLRSMLTTPIEARQSNRKLGLTPRIGETHQQAGPVKVPDVAHVAVAVLASKLSKAIYY